MEETKLWYCGGHNIFASDFHSDDFLPECNQCGSMMTTDSEGFLTDEEMTTWYCGGHNIFSSDLYSDDNRPDCAACGRMMTTDSEGFDRTLALIEDRGIAAVEAKLKIGFFNPPIKE